MKNILAFLVLSGCAGQSLLHHHHDDHDRRKLDKVIERSSHHRSAQWRYLYPPSVKAHMRQKKVACYAHDPYLFEWYGISCRECEYTPCKVKMRTKTGGKK